MDICNGLGCGEVGSAMGKALVGQDKATGVWRVVIGVDGNILVRVLKVTRSGGHSADDVNLMIRRVVDMANERGLTDAVLVRRFGRTSLSTALIKKL